MPDTNPMMPPISWWQPDSADTAHSSAFSALTALRALQSGRISAGLLYEATYEQRNVFASGLGGGWTEAGFGGLGAGAENNLLTYNAMQIGFDTLASKLAQADCQVRFLTDGGNWADRKKAEQLEKLVRGEFYRLKFYEVADMARLDMLLHGRGYMKWYYDEDAKRPCVERIHPLDIYFDELESRDNPPQQMYQVKLVSKAVLKAMYPEHAEAIDRAQISGDSMVYSTRGLNPVECCEILEAWHLKSGAKAGDGKRILAIQTATLALDDYDRDCFPFSTITWVPRRRGPYPLSAAEQVVFMQRNLNRLIQREHECIYELAAPRLLIDVNCDVPDSQFQTAGVGDIIRGNFTGASAPVIMNPSVVPADIVNAIAQAKRDIFDVLGITGLESVGEKPTGVDSAPAMQEYTEQSSLRHVKTLKENERFVLRSAEMLLDTIRDIAGEYGDYVAYGHFKDSVEEIPWKDIDMEPDAYVVQMAPANLLPNTPAGRKQDVIQLAGAGVLSPKQAVRALQSPDILAITDELTSSEQDIEWTIYEMTKPNGRYLSPEVHQDLVGAIPRVRNAYLHERRANAPDEILARLDQWITEADAILQQQRQQLMQEQMMQQQQMAAAQAPMQAPQPLNPLMSPGANPIAPPSHQQ